MKIPEGSRMTVEELADHMATQNKRLDLSKPSTREEMAKAITHDIMTGLAKSGDSVGWYDHIPDAAIQHVAKNLMLINTGRSMESYQRPRPI
jgi:hypothetical protein